jgi:hypothetical protein
LAASARNAAHLAQKIGATRWRIEALSLLAVALLESSSSEAAKAGAEALALLDERVPVGLDVRLIKNRCAAALRPALIEA